MNWLHFLILVACGNISYVSCWDSEDLEVFDVVEEVGQNFYELLGVPENSDGATIKRAFRKLSLVLHPDKNDAPDAEIKFRQLVAVHDILKDPVKRSKYHEVLENGLPDWKQAVYYYRRVRKMGLMEMSIILFTIITIGQYLVAWAAYFEKKYTIEEFVNMKSKRLQKRQKKGKSVDLDAMNGLPALVEMIPKPSVSCTLPVQICKLSWFLVVDLPPLIIHHIRERRKRAQEVVEEESEEEVYVPRERAPRRRKAFTAPEIKENNENNEIKKKVEPKPRLEPKAPVYAVGLWTDDDFIDLIKLMKKYPPGTQERWEKIGEGLNRHPNEVAQMAHKMKYDGFKPITKKEDEDENLLVEEGPKKVKTKGGKLGDEAEDQSIWTQVQQKAFEHALAANPKGSAADRWEKISKAVPGKTKEECILRYKSLHEQFKKKKQQNEESPS